MQFKTVWFLPGLIFLTVFQLRAGALQFGNFIYEDNGSSITLTGYVGQDALEELQIPDLIDAKPVRVIGQECFRGEFIGRYLIPSSVSSIGDRAFLGKYDPAGVHRRGRQCRICECGWSVVQ
jgi:hypothetical protein